MTVEIDEKQAPEETADDLEFKASINDKSQPDDEYSFECKICNKSMELEHNIHTTALLFQFYKCSCPLIDRHIIVRDKRINESVVHQSKGTSSANSTGLRLHVLNTIILSSLRYYAIRQFVQEAIIDAQLDLIIEKHLIAEYDTKSYDVKDDLQRLNDSGSLISIDNSIQKSIDRDDITGVNHAIRLHESNISFHASSAWLSRLEYDTSASVIRSPISHLADAYVHKISDHELDDYNKLIDMILCVSTVIDDLCDKVNDGKYRLPDDAIIDENELMSTLDNDQLTYAQLKEVLHRIIDRHLLNIYAKPYSKSTLLGKFISPINEKELKCTLHNDQLINAQLKQILDTIKDRHPLNIYAEPYSNSMQLGKYISPIDEYAFSSNLMMPNIKYIVTIIVNLMLSQIDCSVRAAKSELRVEELKMLQKEHRDDLKSHN